MNYTLTSKSKIYINEPKLPDLQNSRCYIHTNKILRGTIKKLQFFKLEKIRNNKKLKSMKKFELKIKF